MQKKPVFLNIMYERTEEISLVFKLIIATSYFLLLPQPPLQNCGRNIELIFDDFDLVTNIYLQSVKIYFLYQIEFLFLFDRDVYFSEFLMI